MDYKTIRQAAKATGITESTLRKMRKAGQLPGFCTGTRFYVDVEKLAEVLRSGITVRTGNGGGC